MDFGFSSCSLNVNILVYLPAPYFATFPCWHFWPLQLFCPMPPKNSCTSSPIVVHYLFPDVLAINQCVLIQACDRFLNFILNAHFVFISHSGGGGGHTNMYRYINVSHIPMVVCVEIINLSNKLFSYFLFFIFLWWGAELQIPPLKVIGIETGATSNDSTTLKM